MNQNTFPKLAKGLRLSYCAALMAVLAVSQVPVRTAQASNIFERIQIKEKTAFAEWQYQEGNVITFVQVVVAESAAQPGSVEAPMPTAAISIFRQTTDGIVMVAASGLTNTFDFAVDTALTSAQFSAALVLSNVADGTLLPVTVDLTWTGTGDLIQEHSFEQFREEGFSVISNLHGAHRPADAAGTLLGEGINFTPMPANSAQIQRNDNGGVIVLTGHDASP